MLKVYGRREFADTVEKHNVLLLETDGGNYFELSETKDGRLAIRSLHLNKPLTIHPQAANSIELD